MKVLSLLQSSAITSLWFMFLTFPIMVIRVNTIENTIEWRWPNIIYVGITSFILSFIWQYLLEHKSRTVDIHSIHHRPLHLGLTNFIHSTKIKIIGLIGLCIGCICFPIFVSTYQVNIMNTALIYVMLGLGLNIVVGLAGLLDLGYVAFYAVGAYSYALLNYHFNLGFWFALPIGGILGAVFGIILGFPVLRLRGDYLAIVTLGFGEIIRLVLENWSAFSFGPVGIRNIPRPGLFEQEMDLNQASIYLYFIMIGLVLMTIFIVNRLQYSRIGRAWVALREDEIACQAMGIDITKTKLTAFALGAMWAGMAGVIFAAKTTFINPPCFTFLESAIILSIVVLGGMGSIIGVIIAALVLVLMPEYLRAFSEYRMLIFGAIMVLMMIFRPQGIIPHVRKIRHMG